MKEFLEKSLRQNVRMTENKEIYKKLPLAYRGRYDIFTVETNGVLWMAIQPRDDVGLVLLRRDRTCVEKMTGLNCAIFLERTTFYIKEKLMEEGIPFVIEYLNIGVLDMKGKSRVINIPDDRKQLWQQIESVLRNPVIRRFVLRKDMKLEKKAGISALCEYSLLSDNAYPTYAVTKKELKASGVKVEKQASELEEIGCVVFELGYFIDFLGKGLQDPFSVVLSQTREEQEEERVDISINEMLEEYVWSKD